MFSFTAPSYSKQPLPAQECLALQPILGKREPLPVAGFSVQGGFPSPAEDFLEGTLDLNEHLIQRPSATFFIRYSGESMIGAGLFPGDILIVDRGEEAQHGDIVVACVNGEMTCKRLFRRAGSVRLDADNPQFPSLHFSDGVELVVWGVVTASIKQFKRVKGHNDRPSGL